MNSSQKKIANRQTKEKIFVYLMLLYPIIHFLIFYVGVNFNSIIMAFMEFDESTAQFKFFKISNIFDNFIRFIKDIGQYDLLRTGFKNSFYLFLFGLLIQTPLNIIFAYFMYKKIPGNRLFRDILFLPAILSSIVMVLMYKYFVEYGIPVIAKLFGNDNMGNLLVMKKTAFPMIILYNLWAGFGGTLLLYANAMSKIPVSLVEYGKLEGMNAWNEIVSLILPFIFPTLSVFLVVSVADFFINQGPLFAFYGYDVPGYLYTVGFFMFIKIFREDSSMVNFPYIAAGGIVFTLIAAPLTFIVRKVLDKICPDVQI